MASEAKDVCAKFEWNFDYDQLRTDGFLESPIFGNENSTTKFALRLEYDARPTECSLHLILASHSESKLNVELTINFVGDNADYIENGEITLDKSKKVGWTKYFWLERYSNCKCKVDYKEVPNQLITKPADHTEKLVEQLSALHLNPFFSDVTICATVDGKEFKAHKVLLALRSSVFAAMFNHKELAENQNKRVEIPDVAGAVLEAFLAYIYSGDVSGVGKYSTELLELADKYNIPLLVEACIQDMLKNIKVENAAQIFYLADLHQLKELKTNAGQFIGKHHKQVRQTEGWAQFIKTNVNLIEEMLDYANK